MFRRHPILTLVTVAYLGVVAGLTLTPMPAHGRNSIIWRFVDIFERFPQTRWLDFATVEFLGNVAMFLPLGLFLVLLLGRGRWWLAILFGVGLTLTIELVQQFLPSRVSDPRDLAANSIGVTLGVLAALVVTAAKARRLRAQRVNPPAPVTPRRTRTRPGCGR
jgi:glycopeptide antibiotics resistance protein